MQPKSLVIKIPSIPWKRIFSLRMFFLGLMMMGFAYWFIALRPYLWISGGQINVFSLPISPDLSGRIVQMGPTEGEIVQRGQLLFAFDTALLRSHQMQLKHQIDAMNEQLHVEQQKMDQAMQLYLEAPQPENFAAFEEAQAHADKLSQELASKQTEWESLELQTQKLAFRAPFDGFVLRRSAQEGSVVSFGEPLYTLCDPSRLWIEASIPEKTLSRLSLGQPIRVRLLAFPKKEWKGKLSWIGPAASASQIPIRVSIEDPEFPARPGLSAKLGIKLY